MKHRPHRTTRRGAIAPLTALLIIPILGMVAFAIDIGYITETNLELQNAADAAALAAAEQLPPYYVQYYLQQFPAGTDQTTVLNNAQTQANLFAKTYAGFHRAGPVSNIVLDTTNDVELGYQDANTPYQSPPPAGTFPNTVQVTLRLDGGANTNPRLALFFGPVLGMSQVTVTARARATIYNGDVSDFSGPDVALLPATLDVQIWNNFVATGQGSLPDFDYTAPTSNAPSSTPSPGVPGAPQILLVPDPNGRPGGWNYLSLNSSSNSNDDYKNWFSNGLGQSDLNALHSGGQLPLPSQPFNADMAKFFWKGSPGDRGGSEPFPAPGAVRLLPLYQHLPVDLAGPGNYVASAKDNGPWTGSGGVGQNSWFNIVSFVSVVITDNSNGLSVQPAAMTDPNVILSNLQAAGKPTSTGQIRTTFAAPKLTY
jgi:Flp pilus assembly protein TadG